MVIGVKTWIKLFWLLLAVLPLGVQSLSANLSLPTDSAASELRISLSSADFMPSSERDLGRRIDNSESSSADTEQDDVVVSSVPDMGSHGNVASATIALATLPSTQLGYHVIRGPPQYF